MDDSRKCTKVYAVLVRVEHAAYEHKQACSPLMFLPSYGFTFMYVLQTQ